MNAWNYIQIEAIPLIALALILIASTTELQPTKNMRRFRIMIILVISILIVDDINWYLLSNPINVSENLLWSFNILYFILTEVIAFFWFLYVFYQIHDNDLSHRRKVIINLCVIPLIAICAIIITSPWNHMIFYIDPENHEYHRGTFHLLQVACGFGFMFMASVHAYIQSRKDQLTEKKNECRFLCCIVILPFIGGALQIINYDFIFLWPLTAAAAFLIFIDYQSHRISIDSLTSLNNRGMLEQYLNQKVRGHDQGWYVIMMDIDRFKVINDKYGHMEGDRTLQIVSQMLKNVFGKTNTFLSRFGGDEFVVIGNFDSDDELDSVLKKCKEDLHRQKIERKVPYDISISVGYSRFENADKTPARVLMRTADERMYKQKRIHIYRPSDID